MDRTLGKVLEQLRGKMSLRVAAERSGLSYTYIRDIERGFNRSTKSPIKPSPDTLQRLAKAYNYPYEELMKIAGYIDEPELDPELIQELRSANPDQLKKVFDFLQSVTRKRFLDDVERLTPDELKSRYLLEIDGKTASQEEIDEAIAFIKVKRIMKDTE